LLQYRWN